MLSENKDITTFIRSEVESLSLLHFFDVTCLLTALKDGQLIHNEEYNLETALCASQIGQIQQDHGLIVSEPHTVQDLETFSLLRPFLSLGEIVAIMDHLIMYEGLWLSGSPLNHTLFTNVYMHHPDLAPVPLRTFCVSILRVIELAKEISIRSQVATVFVNLFLISNTFVD